MKTQMNRASNLKLRKISIMSLNLLFWIKNTRNSFCVPEHKHSFYSTWDVVLCLPTSLPRGVRGSKPIMYIVH